MARYFSRMVWICKNTASQPTIYVQHNFCPFEFHPLQSLTKAGDTVQFFLILVKCYCCLHVKMISGVFQFTFESVISVRYLLYYVSSQL